MSEIIFKIISEELGYKKMLDDENVWVRIENSADSMVPVSYAYQFVLYQNEYFKERYMEIYNCSIVLYNKNTPVGIWPLSVFRKEDGVWGISAWGGREVLCPIMTKTFSIKGKRKIFTKCFSILKKICNRFNINQWISKDFVIEEGVSLWTRMLLENNNYCNNFNIEAYVDLENDERKIFSLIRKSYKSYITSGEKMWTPIIINCKSGNEAIESCFDNFEKLHIKVAGKRTRSHETWKRQCESVKRSGDFVVLLNDKNNELVGASLYSTSGSCGYYSVGVYKRELFEFPLAHVSQWEAIKYMKNIGLKWYHIGTRYYEMDWNQPTHKEVTISYFKEGFATHYFNSLYIDVNIKEKGK